MSDAERAAACAPDGSCITCSDQGLILQVLRVGADGRALCADAEGRREDVQVDLIDAVDAGDVLLVHAGVALVRLRREEVRA